MSRADELEVGILQPARDTDLGGDTKCYARAESLLREDDWETGVADAGIVDFPKSAFLCRMNSSMIGCAE